jgi:hypothetical protein
MDKHLLISFNSKGFDNATKVFQEKKSLESTILLHLKIGELHLEDEEVEQFFKNPEAGVITLIEAKYKEQNTLNLSGSKLIGLLDLKFNVLGSFIEKYLKLQDIQEPNKEDYCTYTANDFEAKRLTLINSFIKATKDINEITGVRYGAIIQALNGIINFNHLTQQLEPNIQFVKDSLR